MTPETAAAPPILGDSLLAVRAPAVVHYVLRDASGLYLLDAGFVGGPALLRRALRRRGWEDEPIRGIIVTHGHLDHILNVAALAREHRAWVAAPALDAAHYAGRPSYSGWSRVAGALERLGRPALGFRPFTPDRLLGDGDSLEVWHGLRAVHLPGHTAGHTGYYCARLRLLFCGDLFASHGPVSHFPPEIFNSDPSRMRASAEKALALDLEGLLPNHCDRRGPAVQLRRFRRMMAELRAGTRKRTWP